MLNFFKAKKENYTQNDQTANTGSTNELYAEHSQQLNAKDNDQDKPKVHGEDGVCCGGCGGQ